MKRIEKLEDINLDAKFKVEIDGKDIGDAIIRIDNNGCYNVLHNSPSKNGNYPKEILNIDYEYGWYFTESDITNGLIKLYELVNDVNTATTIIDDSEMCTISNENISISEGEITDTTQYVLIDGGAVSEPSQSNQSISAMLISLATSLNEVDRLEEEALTVKEKIESLKQEIEEFKTNLKEYFN